ncbi:MAG: glucose-6-phosphate dehydrogenase [Bacteroidota bacterium]
MLDPHILVIFGASGDLNTRKLVPAVFELYKFGLLPDNFAFLGASRTDMTDEEFRQRLIYNNEHLDTSNATQEQVDAYAQMLYYCDISDYADPNDLKLVKTRLSELDKKHNTPGNYIFYLSTPPSLYDKIPAALAQVGLNKRQDGWSRLIVEKPFGYDTDSAEKLNESIQGYFDEDDIYRIDHYLGKETVQNLLVTRFANGFFEPLWNRNYVHSIQITAAETVGVGSRGGYYDDSGALRDMVQNHLLQVLAHIAMEPPIRADAKSIRDEKLKLFRSLRPIEGDDIAKNVIRGQYVAATTEEGLQKGYLEEEGVPQDSKTETYVAIKCHVDNWRWAGVPIYIRTGKHMPMKLTEVVITFTNPPQRIFAEMDDEAMSCDNRLIIRITPKEGMALEFGMKVPGEGFRVKNVDMDFFYQDLSQGDVPEAYERLLLDAMKGDPTLYARGDSVVAAWKFVDGILEGWKNNPNIPVHTYPAGSWGPKAADDLWENCEECSWRNPAEAVFENDKYSLL